MDTFISHFYYRLEEEKNILSEFQEDLNKLILWLEEADSVIRIPLEPGNEDHLRDCLSKVKVSWILFLMFSYFINLTLKKIKCYFQRRLLPSNTAFI